MHWPPTGWLAAGMATAMVLLEIYICAHARVFRRMGGCGMGFFLWARQDKLAGPISLITAFVVVGLGEKGVGATG